MFFQVLNYGQSPYLSDFGMAVEDASGPLGISARVLQPPSLKYGQGSKTATVVCILTFILSSFQNVDLKPCPQTPRDGAWNM
jgi:hypothetical protein